MLKETYEKRKENNTIEKSIEITTKIINNI